MRAGGGGGGLLLTGEEHVVVMGGLGISGVVGGGVISIAEADTNGLLKPQHVGKLGPAKRVVAKTTTISYEYRDRER